MTTQRSHWLLALTLVACTSLDAREPTKTKSNAETPTDPSGTPADPAPKPEPDAAQAVKIVVASVTLEQNCPDPAPASPGVMPASEIAPPSVVAPPAKSASAPAMPPPGDSPSVVPHRRACQQSTLQLEISNDGKSEAAIRIASIELRDVQSNSVLMPIASRLPSAWAGDTAYEQWNERIAANTKLNVSYKLTPPEWYAVETKLGGGVDSHGRQFELGVTVEIDGKPMTVRSPAFARAPEIVMPPT
jgi:hypothetical protein